MDADVAVIGLGTMGSMAAWRLSQRRGVKVIGFEQYGLGHARGAGAGESRLFRAAYHEGTQYVPLLKRSRELWLELGKKSQRPVLLPTGTLSIGDEGSPEMSNVRASVLEHGIPHDFLDAEQLRRRFPQHAVSGSDSGILDKLGGALRPEVAIQSALELARANGAEFHERDTVTALDFDGAGATVFSASGRYRVRHVIVASGPWTGELLPQLSAALVVKPLVLTWFLPLRIADFRADVFPTFIRDTADFHIFGAPSLDEYSLKVSVNDMWGTVANVADLRRWLEDDQLRFVGEKIAKLLPGLSPEPARHSVHMDAYTADRAPIIGASGNATILAGFSGHGFKLSAVFGEIAAQLATDGGADYDIDRFSPERGALLSNSPM